MNPTDIMPSERDPHTEKPTLCDSVSHESNRFAGHMAVALSAFKVFNDHHLYRVQNIFVTAPQSKLLPTGSPPHPLPRQALPTAALRPVSVALPALDTAERGDGGRGIPEQWPRVFGFFH